MAFVMVVGLLLGMSPVADEHRVTVSHGGETMDVVYRSRMDVAHKQIGSVSAPGRQSTLRCAWSAALEVERVAEARGGGVVMRRTIASDTPIRGSVPGWCVQGKRAIDAQVARHTVGARDALMDVAERDRPALVAEIDAHRATRGS